MALLAALALAATVALISVSQRQADIGGAKQAARVQTEFIADSILRSHLHGRDIRSPVSPARRRELDQLFRDEILVNGNVRATVYGVNGQITYSTDRALIGSRLDVAQAAGEQRVQLVNQKLLDSYVPLSLRAGGRGAVFELDQNYVPLVVSTTNLLLPMAVIIGLALLALYVSMFPVPRRVRKRIRAQIERMEQTEHRAFHDALTGLPNRALFVERVQQALETSQSGGGGAVAVMLMDLDRFKEINDTFGHQSGDQLLGEVGENLGRALRPNDTIARLGGDEFAVLAPTVAGPLGAMALAERAAAEVQNTHQVAGIDVDVDASIGIALYPHHGKDVDELMRCADIAMYESKARGVPTLYSVEHDHHSAERLALGAQLRRAITQREILVHYQPKADFETGQITSVEALVRWQHAEHGLLPPDKFIPLAEQTGLIRALTSYVLDTALEQCRRWQRQGVNLSVAVNITGRDLLDQRFADEVKDLLDKWDVMPSRLELEITENTVLTDPTRARSVLAALSELGVGLAIDDFGSGNSSLGYLKRLPIDVLKIDKSFVLQMHANDDDAAIVRSTIDLGHNLGLKVVAEGVSSVTAWNRLHELGCDVAQGYYLSRPVPGTEIAKLLAADTPRGTIPVSPHFSEHLAQRPVMTSSAPSA